MTHRGARHPSVNRSNTSSDDMLLIHEAMSGSSRAFETLVERYRTPVVRLAHRITNNPDDANDVAQDAFIRAYERLGTYGPERPFAPWLMVVTRNLAIDNVRRARLRTRHLQSARIETEPGPEHLALHNDRASRLRSAVTCLPARYREALELFYYSDLTYVQIATHLCLPLGTVKTFLYRGLRKMRDEEAVVGLMTVAIPRLQNS
jgi:RNA polymerase sigma-70 factor (ECF subfamily)